MTLGQEFGGYAANVAHAAEEVERSAAAAARAESRRDRGRHRAQRRRRLHARGRRATSPTYTGPPVRPAANRFRVTQSMGDVLGYSGALRRLAVEVGKIASDLRLLSMGPRAGIAEIQLPAVQPGSSIMPGKVNPSVPEMVNQVCFQVFGCDATILAAAEAGQLELNVMMPVIAWNALHATRILRQAMHVLQDALRRRDRGGRGALPRAARSQHRGRDRAQPVHRLRGNRRDRQDGGRRPAARFASSCASGGLLPDDELDRILSAEAMTSPGVPGAETRTKTMMRQTNRAPRCSRCCVTAAARRSGRSTAGCFLPSISACSRVRIATRGSGPIRSWTRCASRRAASSLTSAPAAAGSRSGWPARRPERHGLRRRRPAADDRGDHAGATSAGRAEERRDGPRHGVGSASARSRSTPC